MVSTARRGAQDRRGSPLERSTDPDFHRLLTRSYRRLVGRPLVPKGSGPDWLYAQASFAVLAHDAAADPLFTYANQAAQACFGYGWAEFVGMPSRLSAEAPDRAARARLLEAVSRDGFVADYAGLRIAKSGERFRIERAVVWQLIDDGGTTRGQAATFPVPA